jgi:hypothetical protein
MNENTTLILEAIRDGINSLVTPLGDIETAVGNIETSVASIDVDTTAIDGNTSATAASVASIDNKTVAPGVWSPPTCPAPADSKVVSAVATTVRAFMVANSGSHDSYIQVFDSPTVPPNGTAPRIPSILLKAGETAVVQLGALECAAGFSWASSSTANVLTITAFNEVQLSTEAA